GLADAATLPHGRRRFEPEAKPWLSRRGGDIGSALPCVRAHRSGTIVRRARSREGGRHEFSRRSGYDSRGSPMPSQSLPPAFADAVSRLHAAMAKVAKGDISAIKALYTHG